jgi:[acyl-carrier-protein] S-malonyltransferase
MPESVLLFPGQGAQHVGMAQDVAARYDAAEETFLAASNAIGVDLRRLCFEGPEEELARTELCQPAILTASVAVLRAIEQALGRPLPVAAAAGLSLGEYSALVAAGSLELPDAVRLVRCRGAYMQEACEARPGTMSSMLGLADEQVECACRRIREEEGGEVWPANYNSPSQVVISGERRAVERASALCVEMGARRAVELKVAGAFHSPLMRPAAEKLAAELERTKFRTPAFPVIANTTARPVEGPEEIRLQLTRQVDGPTRWAESMRWCISEGCDTFLEIGPGLVLQGLLKRIDPKCRCLSIGTAAAVEGLVQATRAGNAADSCGS